MSWAAWWAPPLHGKETVYVLPVDDTESKHWEHLTLMIIVIIFLFSSSTILLEDHLIHVGYTQFDKELLLIAFPADR